MKSHGRFFSELDIQLEIVYKKSKALVVTWTKIKSTIKSFSKTKAVNISTVPIVGTFMTLKKKEKKNQRLYPSSRESVL